MNFEFSVLNSFGSHKCCWCSELYIYWVLVSCKIALKLANVIHVVWRNWLGFACTGSVASRPFSEPAERVISMFYCRVKGKFIFQIKAWFWSGQFSSSKMINEKLENGLERNKFEIKIVHRGFGYQNHPLFHFNNRQNDETGNFLHP